MHDAHEGRSIQGFSVYLKFLRTLLNARIASCLAVLKYWSFDVNAEFKMKTAMDAVSQIATFGPAK